MLRSAHVGYVAKDTQEELSLFLQALVILNLGLEDVTYYMERYKKQGDKLQWFTINLMVDALVSPEQEATLDLLYAG
jgi:hypothetical protein